MLDTPFLDNTTICLSHFALVSHLPCQPTPPSAGDVLLPGAQFSNTNQPIQSSHPQPPPVSGPHTLGHSTCPNYPITRYQTTRGRACAPEPLKLFKLGNAKPAYPASHIPSKESTVKALGHSFPLFLCLLTNPCTFPVCPLHGLE